MWGCMLEFRHVKKEKTDYWELEDECANTARREEIGE